MVWVRNVFLKYGLGAKRFSEIWFGCETSYWTMKTGVKRLFYLWGGGETSFLSMSWGRNVSIKNGASWLWGEKSVYPFVVYKWADLAMYLTKPDTLSQWCFDDGPPSATLDQDQNSIGQCMVFAGIYANIHSCTTCPATRILPKVTPIKHKTFTLCWIIVVPASHTVGQH